MVGRGRAAAEPRHRSGRGSVRGARVRDRGRGPAGSPRGRTLEREPAFGLEPEEVRPAVVAEARPRSSAESTGARAGRLRRRALHLDHRSARLVRGRGRRLVDGHIEQRGDRAEDRGRSSAFDRGVEPPRRSPRPRPARAAREWRRRDGSGRRRAGRVRSGRKRRRRASSRARASSTRRWRLTATSGTGPTAAREVDEEWPPATPGGSRTSSSAQGSSGYVSRAFVRLARCRAARPRGRIGGFVGSSRPEAGGSSPAVRPIDRAASSSICRTTSPTRPARWPCREPIA